VIRVVLLSFTVCPCTSPRLITSAWPTRSGTGSARSATSGASTWGAYGNPRRCFGEPGLTASDSTRVAGKLDAGSVCEPLTTRSAPSASRVVNGTRIDTSYGDAP
jgi:hypothetical protein